MSARAQNEIIMDLEDRDPKQLSEHLHVSWEEIFGEPKTIRSPEVAWSISQNIFNFSRNCCYIFLSVLCAPIAAFFAGILFACLSFKYIWCFNPSFRYWTISCGAFKRIVFLITSTLVIPCTSACGYIFSEIKIKKAEGSSDEHNQDNQDPKLLIV